MSKRTWSELPRRLRAWILRQRNGAQETAFEAFITFGSGLTEKKRFKDFDSANRWLSDGRDMASKPLKGGGIQRIKV